MCINDHLNSYIIRMEKFALVYKSTFHLSIFFIFALLQHKKILQLTFSDSKRCTGEKGWAEQRGQEEERINFHMTVWNHMRWSHFTVYICYHLYDLNWTCLTYFLEMLANCFYERFSWTLCTCRKQYVQMLYD